MRKTVCSKTSFRLFRLFRHGLPLPHLLYYIILLTKLQIHVLHTQNYIKTPFLRPLSAAQRKGVYAIRI